MAANIADKFVDPNSSGRPVPTTLTAEKQVADGSITCASLSGWATDTAVHFVIYETDTDGNKIAGTQSDWKGIVSGSTITGLTLTGGTDQVYPVGATVVASPTAGWGSDLVTGLLEEHKQDGTHGDLTADTITTPEATITDLTVDSITVTGTANTEGWSPLGQTPNTITNNGNRSYDLVFNSVDLTGTLSEGMRMKFTRTTTAPTQSTSLNGTTQYWSKSSPAGTTFTDDFCAGAWVYLTSYAQCGVISRYNGTSGWEFQIDSNGAVTLIGYNASSANYSLVKAAQSIPLNKWVHISAQLDMSAFTATTTTSYVMIDGVDVPATVTRAGTNPTALVQAGDLQVGARNAGTFFPGKIAQAWYSSAKITQANIRTFMSQGITASDISTHSIVSAFSFNGVATDINTTNANNLSASGSAGYTSDSPFASGSRAYETAGTTDYAVVSTKPTFSTNTTVTVQVPEGCAIPTSGGVSAVSYSTQSKPYGFPTDVSRWIVEWRSTALLQKTSPTINTWYNTGVSILVPIGKWRIENSMQVYVTEASGTAASVYSILYTSSSSGDANDETYRRSYSAPGGASTNTLIQGVFTTKDVVLSSATTFYFNLLQDGTNDTIAVWGPNQGASTIKVVPNFL